MSVQVKGSGTIGGLDEGLVVSGIVTSSTQINVGSNIKLGNAGVITATSFVGSGANLTGIDADKIQEGNSFAEILDTGTNGIFRFLPENNEVFRITHEAKVGINTNNPSHNLDISADGVAFPSAAGSTILRLRNSAGSATLSIDANAGNVSAIQFGDTAAASQGTVSYNHSSNHLQFNTSGSERVRITSAGSMGLGTGANIDERVHFENAGNITLLVECSTSGGGSNSAIRLKSADSSSDWYMQTGNAVGGGLRFYSGSERVRITSGGDVGVNGGSDVERKVDIVTSDGNSVLIRPNTGGDNSRGNANVVNNSLIFRMPYGENAGSSANAGARIGIVFTGRNDGSGYIDNPSKSASIYGISEDVSAGYSRLMGMGFFTSPFDAAQTEKMRISAEGYVTTPSQPAFAARLGSGNITITSNTGSDMVFNTEEFDNHNDYDTSNGRFTAPVAGKYYFGVQLYAGFDGAGVRVMHANFRVNGTSVAQADMFGGASNHGGTHYHPTAVGHMFRNLNANDYVTFNLGGFSHTGGQAILYASTGNRFFGYLVG